MFTEVVCFCFFCGIFFHHRNGCVWHFLRTGQAVNDLNVEILQWSIFLELVVTENDMSFFCQSKKLNLTLESLYHKGSLADLQDS